VGESIKDRPAADWREQVKESVARHREKKRRQLEKHDDDARQLSIFPEQGPDELEDEPQKAQRQRRAEIRARVEERLARRRAAPAVKRVVDAGELPLGRGNAMAAVARELVSEPAEEQDPRTVELEPLGRSLPMSPAEEEREPDLDASPEEMVPLGLASAGERVFSGLIDLAFVALIQLTLFYLTTHLVAQRMGALPQSALVSMGLVGALLAASYFLFFWSLSGQTLGKLLTGSRVVTTRGGTLGFGRSALRLAATLLSVLPLGAGLIGLWTDPERRGWHDRMAGTKVIRG